jgi:hypothetical protein
MLEEAVNAFATLFDEVTGEASDVSGAFIDLLNREAVEALDAFT